MNFEPFTSSIIPFLRDNVDTDLIYPARFLTVTDKTELGACLFADLRADPAFFLNQPEYAGAQILLTGANFGCGSSREHAAWALIGAGIRAVIAPSFGDIFRANALKNGLLPIPLDSTVCDRLRFVPKLTVDLAAQTVSTPEGEAFPFPIDPFAKACLLKGVDELGYILSFEEKITEFETVIDDGR